MNRMQEWRVLKRGRARTDRSLTVDALLQNRELWPREVDAIVSATISILALQP